MTPNRWPLVGAARRFEEEEAWSRATRISDEPSDSDDCSGTSSSNRLARVNWCCATQNLLLSYLTGQPGERRSVSDERQECERIQFTSERMAINNRKGERARVAHNEQQVVLFSQVM